MKQPYIVETVRTAIGRIGGSLKDVTVDHLAEKVIREVLNRTNPEIEVDEVILGQAKQSADASNLARLAALRAGLPIRQQGLRFTVNVGLAFKHSIPPICR